MGTGAMTEGLALERGEVQSLVICSILLVLTGSLPNSPDGTRTEPLHTLGLVPARSKSFLYLESLVWGGLRQHFSV